MKMERLLKSWTCQQL